MKNVTYIILMITFSAALISCGGKRDPGRVYMPDMAYSRAYEAYAQHDLGKKGMNYIGHPVEGTIKRGDLFPYTIANDSIGYNMSASVKNPLDSLSSVDMAESKRLYNINCGICHGANMDAQGPLATSGKVGGIANLKLPKYVAMSEGTMFHVATYGKGNMGSYAAQLTKQQRWMIVKYIKSVQQGTASKTDSTAAGNAAATDSAAVKING